MGEELAEIVLNEIQVFLRKNSHIRAGKEEEIEEILAGVEKYIAGAILIKIVEILPKEGKIYGDDHEDWCQGCYGCESVGYNTCSSELRNRLLEGLK